MTSAENTLSLTRFVADHWREGALRLGEPFAAHALCMVIAALDGETDPSMCGITPDAWDQFNTTLSEVNP